MRPYMKLIISDFLTMAAIYPGCYEDSFRVFRKGHIPGQITFGFLMTGKGAVGIKI